MQQAQAMVAEATRECEALKEQARNYAVSVTEGAHNFITNSLAGYQSIAMTNLDTINKVHGQFQNEYANQVKILGITPKK